MRLIMVPGASAYEIWTKAMNHFLDNKVSGAIALEAKLCALTQCELPVLQYASRISLMGSLIWNTHQ